MKNSSSNNFVFNLLFPAAMLSLGYFAYSFFCKKKPSKPEEPKKPVVPKTLSFLENLISNDSLLDGIKDGAKNSTLFVLVLHGFDTIGTLILYLFRLGIPYQNLILLTKPHTTSQEMIEYFNLNVEYVPPAESFVAGDYLAACEEKHERLFQKIKDDLELRHKRGQGIKRWVILEEGGRFSEYLHRHPEWESMRNRYKIYSIEHTQCGTNSDINRVLRREVLNLAESAIKKRIVTCLVTKVMFDCIVKSLDANGLRPSNILVGMIGCGAIGRGVLFQLVKQGYRVVYCDHDSEAKRKIQEFIDDNRDYERFFIRDDDPLSVLKRTNVTIGATGKDVGDIELESIFHGEANKEKYFISCSSGEREVESWLKMHRQKQEQENNDNHINVMKDGLKMICLEVANGNKLHLINAGMPINFSPEESFSLPLNFAQVVRSLSFCAVIQILQKISNGNEDLAEMDEDVVYESFMRLNPLYEDIILKMFLEMYEKTSSSEKSDIESCIDIDRLRENRGIIDESVGEFKAAEAESDVQLFSATFREAGHFNVPHFTEVSGFSREEHLRPNTNDFNTSRGVVMHFLKNVFGCQERSLDLNQDGAVVVNSTDEYCVIYGNGGYGKTTSALDFLNEHSEYQYIAWIDGQKSIHDQLAGWLRHNFGIDWFEYSASGYDFDVDEKLCQLLNSVDSFLIVLDNVRAPEDLNRFQLFRHITGNCPSVFSGEKKNHVIITSRSQNWRGSHVIEMGGFTSEEAQLLLNHSALEHTINREIRYSDDEVDLLCDELNHSPLGISHAVAYMDNYRRLNGTAISIHDYLRALNSQEVDHELLSDYPSCESMDDRSIPSLRAVHLSRLLFLQTTPIDMPDYEREQYHQYLETMLACFAYLDGADMPSAIVSNIASVCNAFRDDGVVQMLSNYHLIKFDSKRELIHLHQIVLFSLRSFKDEEYEALSILLRALNNAFNYSYDELEDLTEDYAPWKNIVVRLLEHQKDKIKFDEDSFAAEENVGRQYLELATKLGIYCIYEDRSYEQGIEWLSFVLDIIKGYEAPRKNELEARIYAALALSYWHQGENDLCQKCIDDCLSIDHNRYSEAIYPFQLLARSYYIKYRYDSKKYSPDKYRANAYLFSVSSFFSGSSSHENFFKPEVEELARLVGLYQQSCNKVIMDILKSIVLIRKAHQLTDNAEYEKSNECINERDELFRDRTFKRPHISFQNHNRLKVVNLLRLDKIDEAKAVADDLLVIADQLGMTFSLDERFILLDTFRNNYTKHTSYTLGLKKSIMVLLGRDSGLLGRKLKFGKSVLEWSEQTGHNDAIDFARAHQGEESNYNLQREAVRL